MVLAALKPGQGGREHGDEGGHARGQPPEADAIHPGTIQQAGDDAVEKMSVHGNPPKSFGLVFAVRKSRASRMTASFEKNYNDTIYLKYQNIFNEKFKQLIKNL